MSKNKNIKKGEMLLFERKLLGYFSNDYKMFGNHMTFYGRPEVPKFSYPTSKFDDDIKVIKFEIGPAFQTDDFTIWSLSNSYNFDDIYHAKHELVNSEIISIANNNETINALQLLSNDEYFMHTLSSLSYSDKQIKQFIEYYIETLKMGRNEF